jgi:hypothetical protein
MKLKILLLLINIFFYNFSYSQINKTKKEIISMYGNKFKEGKDSKGINYITYETNNKDELVSSSVTFYFTSTLFDIATERQICFNYLIINSTEEILNYQTKLDNKYPDIIPNGNEYIDNVNKIKYTLVIKKYISFMLVEKLE